MHNKGRYFETLERLLKEHYNEIITKRRVSEHRQHYIDGYMMAARALGDVSYDELQEVIEKIHLEVFGRTIEERRRSELDELSQDDASLAIPAYVRQGIELDD